MLYDPYCFFGVDVFSCQVCLVYGGEFSRVQPLDEETECVGSDVFKAVGAGSGIESSFEDWGVESGGF